MESLRKEIKQCTVCKDYLQLGPNPVMAASPQSKIVIIGQAPGVIVHATGIPWNDKSGENLRRWMDIDEDTFYDSSKIAIVPMGFCYPGKGKSGDLPPRKECAPLWHSKLLEKMPDVELVLLIGKYAQNYYIPDTRKLTLTQSVKAYKDFLPNYFLLPHPSPRNNIWQAKNKWFRSEVLPALKANVHRVLAQ